MWVGVVVSCPQQIRLYKNARPGVASHVEITHIRQNTIQTTQPVLKRSITNIFHANYTNSAHRLLFRAKMQHIWTEEPKCHNHKIL